MLPKRSGAAGSPRSATGGQGGYFNVYYDGQPFSYKGKTLRIKNALRLTSPLRYRNTTTVSIDGGPYTNYGSAWFEKDVTSTPPR